MNPCTVFVRSLLLLVPLFLASPPTADAGRIRDGLPGHGDGEHESGDDRGFGHGDRGHSPFRVGAAAMDMTPPLAGTGQPGRVRRRRTYNGPHLLSLEEP